MGHPEMLPASLPLSFPFFFLFCPQKLRGDHMPPAVLGTWEWSGVWGAVPGHRLVTEEMGIFKKKCIMSTTDSGM